MGAFLSVVCKKAWLDCMSGHILGDLCMWDWYFEKSLCGGRRDKDAHHH